MIKYEKPKERFKQMEDKIKSLEKEVSDVYGQRADCQRVIDRLEKQNYELQKKVEGLGAGKVSQNAGKQNGK